MNAALEGGDIHVLLLAMQNVIKAQGGPAKIVKKAKKNRTSLYKSLGVAGNPYLKNVKDILSVLGMHLTIMPNKKLTRRAV